MDHIKSQIKNWVLAVFHPEQNITIRAAIYTTLSYSLLLHALIQISFIAGTNAYSYGYDMEVYSIWAKAFSEQLLSGELYPRWAMNLNAGTGQPTYFFYPPLVFYVGTLFYVPEILATNPYFQIQMLSFLGTFLAAITFYFWARRHISSYIALVSALVYASFHYHFNVDILLRQAIAEQWSFVWMPLIMLATDRLFEKCKLQIPLLAFSYFLLLITHLVSALIFSLGLGIYLLMRLYHQSGSCAELLMKFILAILLGTGMAALLILPIMELKPFVNLHLFTAGSWNYGGQFMFMISKFGLTQDLPSCFWAVAAPVLCLIFYRDAFKSGKLSDKNRKAMLAMVMLCFFSSFMAVPLSKPLWDVLPPLQMVQFPWRFFILQVLSFCLVAGIYFQATNKHSEILLAICLGSILIYTLLPRQIVESQFEGLKDEPLLIYTTKSQSLGEIKKIWRTYNFSLNAELNPAGTNKCNNAKTAPEYSFCYLGIFEQIKDQPFLLYDKKAAAFEVLERRPRHTTISYQTDTQKDLTVKQSYFHGNVAYTDKGEIIPLSNNADGLITMAVPKGQGVITISTPYFMSEKIGAAISLASLIILLMMVAFEFSRMRSEQCLKSTF